MPGNVAVAVHPDVDYVKVSIEEGGDQEYLILAKPLLEKVMGDRTYKVVKSFKGKQLKNKYLSLIHIFNPGRWTV